MGFVSGSLRFIYENGQVYGVAVDYNDTSWNHVVGTRQLQDGVYTLKLYLNGNLVDGKFSPGLESSEVKLFSKNEIPWDEIAFLVITRTIKLYYQDLKNDTMKMHFETIDKNL